MTSDYAQFKAEADYCVTARDDTWSSFYQILNAAENDMPTLEKVMYALPELTWPDEADKQ